MAVLKPCPFCGEKDITFGYAGQPAMYAYAYCPNCGAQGPCRDTNASTAGGAINWYKVVSGWQDRQEEPNPKGFTVVNPDTSTAESLLTFLQQLSEVDRKIPLKLVSSKKDITDPNCLYFLLTEAE